MRSFTCSVATITVLVLLAAGMTEARLKMVESGPRSGRGNQAAATPAHCLAAHRIGRIELAVANNGTFGREYHPGESRDWFTGEAIPLSCEYPKGSNVAYLFGGAFWIGAVSGRDTLVSTGADGWQLIYEMYPDAAPFGEMIYRSIRDPDDPVAEGAVSEEDYVAVYTDTFTSGVPNDYFGRPHQPLDIEVTQSSYAWSYSYAEDFVLFDYQIRNIGTQVLRDVYMGIYVDAMVCYSCFDPVGFDDDHSGFRLTFPNPYRDCVFNDTVFIAWQADDDGDFDVMYSDGKNHPAPHAVATRIVRTPAESLDVSFNWWIGNGDASLDFGPRERAFMGQWREPFRDFGTGGLGTPEGDVNKYYVMRNREFDYDQIYTASISPTDSAWTYPHQDLAPDFADGYDTRYLLSFGPFDIHPGQSLPVSFAYLAGEDFHHPGSYVEYLPDDPASYYANLNFSDLAINAMWASWVYDNPGVDTDGDGYRGEFRRCCTDTSILRIDTISFDPPEYDTIWMLQRCDTIYYMGDGIPDFRGASPPPAPVVRAHSPSEGTIVIRFNGLRSETTRDVFSGEMDFEGYRVYLGRDERESSFSMLASYDREDYNKYVFNTDRVIWELAETPFLLEELRCLYGASCDDTEFDPLNYTRSRPYVHPQFPDSVFYFEPQDFNFTDLGGSRGIHKRFPDHPYPSHMNPDSARADELTEDGYFKYFEYEFVIGELLPSVPYYVNVTAFDYGSPQSGLRSLESSVTSGAKMVYPVIGGAPDGSGQKILVYPNPYRIDGGYRSLGFEGRTESDRPDDRVRAIHFANLPHRCTIRIYTLDGDLVREIVHDFAPNDPGAGHDQWDLITRNTQLVVSGLYYWSVQAENGEVTIGKLAIIM